MDERVCRLRTYLVEHDLYAVFLTDPANVFYFSGFTGTNGDATLLITQQDAFILTDSRYKVQVTSQCADFVQIGKSSHDLNVLREIIPSAQHCKIGFENKTIAYALWQKMQRVSVNIAWIELGDFPSELRGVKSLSEIERIRRACQISVQALSETVPYIRIGVRENEVAAELEYRLRRLGADGLAFDTIVASGERSAMPHGTASSRILREGDAITIDFGAMFQGYASDMTRTFFLGSPPEELIRIYNAVLIAQQTAIDQFKMGMLCCELDNIARTQLTEMGYGAYFIHSLGHGVGIQVHEGLSVSARSKEQIQQGMVFSIEPGVYIDGLGGVRIEDLVVSTENGLEVLTKDFEKKLAIL